MNKIILFFILIFSFQHVKAQDENIRYYDYIYVDYIATVTLNTGYIDSNNWSNYTSSRKSNFAAVSMGGSLVLSFDDLEGDSKNYSYTLVHCDRNWKPSANLTEFDYIKGFSNDLIRNKQLKSAARSLYTNYQVQLPNENVSWRISGNYLLKVYNEEDDKKLVITRRFVVYENNAEVAILPSPTISSDKRETHHEFDINVKYLKSLEVRSPLTDFSLTFLQNGRWDNAIYDIKPTNTQSLFIQFNYQGKLVFPAGRNFRTMDISSSRVAGMSTKSIEMGDESIQIGLRNDVKLYNRSAEGIRTDLYGNFIITERTSWDIEYVDVLFTLESALPIYDKDIYIFGAMSDWQIRPEYKMTFNPEEKAYSANIYLRQGVYSYTYIEVPKGFIPDKKTLSEQGMVISNEEVDGNYYETTNQYQVIVYFRPFGTTYDRVIGRGQSAYFFPR